MNPLSCLRSRADLRTIALTACLTSLPFAGSVNLDAAGASQGSAAINRSYVDGAEGQVFIYGGGSLAPNTRVTDFTWFVKAAGAGRRITPILFERTAPNVFAVRGVGTTRVSAAGSNSAAFGLQYGSDVVTNADFTWGFVNSHVAADGTQSSATTGAVDFDYSVGGSGVGGAGTTNTWYFTPSTFGPGAVLSLGFSLGLGAGDHGLDQTETRAYSAFMTSGAYVAPIVKASPARVELWATTGRVSPFEVPLTVTSPGAFTASADRPWITISTASPAPAIGANAASLAPGRHTGTVTIAAPGAEPVSVGVVVHVANPQAALQESPLTLAAQRPLSITSADFNRDGRADFVVTNDSGGAAGRNLQVFTDTGGSFSSQVFATVGQGLDVMTGDVNGDGWTDIAAVAWGARAVDLLINDGTGAFTMTSPPLGEGVNGFDVALGDVDEDGRDDLVVATFDADNVSVIRSGATGFSEPLAVGACHRAQSVAAGDVNGDGHVDVAALCDGDATVRVYVGDGTGAFAPAPVGPLPGAGQSDLAVADLDGDGRQDLVVGGSYNEARLYLGDATNGVRASALVLPAAPVRIGDVNGDGYPDLVFRDGTSVIVYEGDAGGAFSELGRFGQDFQANDIVIADFDGDGANDVVGAWPPSGVIRALTAAPAETTAALQPPASPTFGGPMPFTLSVTASGVTPIGTGQLFLCNASFECETAASAHIAGEGSFVLPVNVVIARGYHYFKARFTPSNNTLASESDTIGVNVGQADSTLALANPGHPPVGGVPFAVSATITPAAATGIVQFHDAAHGIQLATASIVDGVATATIPGLTSGFFYTLQARYDGDANVRHSVSNYIDFHVAQGGSSISLAGLTREWTGQPAVIDLIRTPADLPVDVTYSGSAAPPTDIGDYAVVATSTDPNRPATAAGTLRITPNHNATIDVPSLTVTYDGQSHSTTPVTNPAGLHTIVTFKNVDTGAVSTSAPVEPGWYQQLVDVSDPRATQLHQGVGWIHIEKRRATVTLSDLVRTAVPGQLVTPTVTTDPAGLSVSLTYNGLPNLQGVGTYEVAATVQEAYWEGNATATFVLLAPRFSLSNLVQTFDGAPKFAGVTAAVAGTPYSITYDGSSVAPVNAGSYSVVVTSTDPAQPGSVTGTLVIQKGTATFVVSNTSQVYNGTPRPVTVTTTPPNLETQSTYGGSTAAPVNAGTFAFAVTMTDPNVNTVAPQSGTLTIVKAAAQITLGGLTQGDTGQPRPVTVTTTPPGLNTAVTYDGSITPPTAAGSYAVVAAVNDANYSGTATATLSVVPRAVTTMSARYGASFLPRSGPGVPIPDIAHGAATLAINVSGGTPVTGRVEVRDLFNNQTSTVLYTTPSTVTLPVSIPVTLPVGRHQLTLSYLGDDLHQPATLVTVFDIVRATPSITPDFDALTTTFDGRPKSVPFTVMPNGTNYTVTYDGSTTPPADAGTYRVVARTNDPSVVPTSAQYTLTINRMQASIALSDLVQTADGTPKSPTASVTPALPAGYTVSFTFDGRRNPPSRIGGYQVVASNPNITGVATAAFTLVAPLSITGGTFTYDGTPKAATVTFEEPITRIRSVVYTGTNYTSETAPTNAGTYTVTATGCGGGNGCNNVVTTTLIINRAQVSLSFDSLSNGTTGDPVPVVVTWAPSSFVAVPLTITYDGATTPPVNAGSYAVAATLDSPNFVPQTLNATYSLTPWRTKMSLTGRRVNWTGQPQPLAFAISPANAPYTLTYEKQGGLPLTTAPSEAGLYTVVAQATGGYAGRLTATLEISGYLTLGSDTSTRPFTFTVDGSRFAANAARIVSPLAHTVVAEGGQVNALERYRFDHWRYSGGTVSGSPSEMPSSVTTWGNAFFTAVPKSEYAVITNVTQGQGTVTGDGWYAGTARVQLLATPAPGWFFDSFVIDGNEIRENGYFLSMAGAGHRVRVRFVQASTVTVISAPVAGGTLTGSTIIPINTTTAVAAVAQPGFEFVRWDISGGSIVGGALAGLQTPATIRATTTAVTVTAMFKPTMQIEFWSQQWYNAQYTADVKLTNTGSLPITGLQLTEASSSRRVMQRIDELPELLGTLQPGQSMTWQMRYLVVAHVPPPNYTLQMTFMSAEGYQYTRSIFVNLIAR